MHHPGTTQRATKTKPLDNRPQHPTKTASIKNKEWVENKINEIFPKSNANLWAIGFSSYLFHSSTIAKDIYGLLKANNHYKMAIEQPDLSHRHAFSKLPQHIGIAYLYDLENVSKDSLLNDLIVSKNATYLLDLVYFFWHLRDKLNEKTREKIKPLWAAIINSCTQAGEINYKEVLASLSYWLSLIDTIDDDVVAWMQISNKYLSDRSPLFYLEYLNRHVKNP